MQKKNIVQFQGPKLGLFSKLPPPAHRPDTEIIDTDYESRQPGLSGKQKFIVLRQWEHPQKYAQAFERPLNRPFNRPFKFLSLFAFLTVFLLSDFQNSTCY